MKRQRQSEVRILWIAIGVVVLLSLLAINAVVRGQESMKLQAGSLLQGTSWCVSQRWLGRPDGNGGLVYSFLGQWSEREKGAFITRCDGYNRGVLKRAHAQRDKSVAAATPKVYRLSPEDSVAYQALENKKSAIIEEANRQLADVVKDQKLIMALAGVPKAELDRKPTPEGDHFVFNPKPSPTPKPQ